MFFPASTTPVQAATKSPTQQVLLALFGPWIVNLYIYFHQVPLFKNVWSYTSTPPRVFTAWLY
jgi:hypothetical protein